MKIKAFFHLPFHFKINSFNLQRTLCEQVGWDAEAWQGGLARALQEDKGKSTVRRGPSLHSVNRFGSDGSIALGCDNDSDSMFSSIMVQPTRSDLYQDPQPRPSTPLMLGTVLSCR